MTQPSDRRQFGARRDTDSPTTVYTIHFYDGRKARTRRTELAGEWADRKRSCAVTAVTY
jgi:hypothetical protein